MDVDVLVVTEDAEFLPVYSSSLAAGADVKAFIEQDVVIEPGASALIPTGLKLQIPQGYEVQVRPRSGLALKHQVTVLNTPGTVDADYRGDVGVILINHGKNPFIVSRGMRVAQFVLAKVEQANFSLASQLSTTLRGVGGFGHTGTH